MSTHNDRPVRVSRSVDGFTLIELMLVVAIVAILSAIALPSYDEYVRRGRRADAQAQLLQVAQYLERHYTTHGNYGSTLPQGLAQSPATGTAQYNLTLSTNPPGYSVFTLTATPTGGMQGDKCGEFILAHTGAKFVASATVAIDQCWNR